MDVYCISALSKEDAYAFINKANPHSLVIMGYGIIDDINLVQELSGDSECIKDLCILSKQKNLNMIIGVVAKCYTKVFLSALVIDKGAIIGMSDMTHNLNSEFSLGYSYRIYNMCNHRIGVLVGDDIFFPEATRALCVNGADFIAHIGQRSLSPNLSGIIKTLSHLNGTSIISVGDLGCISSEEDGALSLVSETNLSYFKKQIKTDNKYLLALREDIYHKVYMEGKDIN